MRASIRVTERPVKSHEVMLVERRTPSSRDYPRPVLAPRHWFLPLAFPGVDG